MKRVVLLLLAVLSTNVVRCSQYFYTVDFSSPLHQVGQPPTTGAGPQTPSSIIFGSPTVVSSFGHLTNQPLLFKGIGYQQIGFDLNRGAPDYFLDFDFETHNLNPSLFVFTMLFDCPEVETFDLHGLGGIEIPDYSFLPGWTDDEPHHMHVDLNITNRTWILQFDSRPPVSGSFFHASGPDVLSLRLNLFAWRYGTPDDPSIQIAIDNIRIGTSVGVTSPTITCPAPLVLECTNGTVATLRVDVEDSSTNAVTVVWTVDGTPYQTNTIPAGGALTSTNVTFTADLGLGEHSVLVSASNGQTASATCSTTVSVRDTTPPTISRISAMPSVLWPPNGRMVPVRIDVEAQDNCGPTRCKIVQVQSSERPHSFSHRTPSADWQITGDLTVNLRAEREEQGRDRIYTIILECEDAVGNTSQGSVTVAVPHHQAIDPRRHPAG
jgi:hypothetical protein